MSNATATVAATISEIISHAKAHADASTVTAPVLAIGEFIAQGDLNFIAVDPKRLAKVTTRTENPSLQLAPGNSQGSRHCIAASSANDVVWFTCKESNPLMGPWLQVNAPALVEHPEHGNIILQPGSYAVTYQCAWAEELRRIQD